MERPPKSVFCLQEETRLGNPLLTHAKADPMGGASRYLRPKGRIARLDKNKLAIYVL